MSSRTVVLQRQRDWAARAGMQADARGYLAEVTLNLFQPMSDGTLRDFTSGSGAELLPGTGRPPKMAALHSSAALAVNVFDYWSDKPLQSVANALRIPSTPSRLQFEAQFPTGLRGTPPNLDLAFHYPDGRIVAVESKFTEWLTPKAPTQAPFKDKYFSGRPLWAGAGLHGAQALADAIQAGEHRFSHLDAPQLLKHMLGLSTCAPGRVGLCYLYFDCAGPESSIHEAEIGVFATAIGHDMPFHALSYQSFFDALLPRLGETHRAYLEYLSARYIAT